MYLEKRFRGIKGRRQSEVDATGRRLKQNAFSILQLLERT